MRVAGAYKGFERFESAPTCIQRHRAIRFGPTALQVSAGMHTWGPMRKPLGGRRMVVNAGEDLRPRVACCNHRRFIAGVVRRPERVGRHLPTSTHRGTSAAGTASTQANKVQYSTERGVAIEVDQAGCGEGNVPLRLSSRCLTHQSIAGVKIHLRTIQLSFVPQKSNM